MTGGAKNREKKNWRGRSKITSHVGALIEEKKCTGKQLYGQISRDKLNGVLLSPGREIKRGYGGGEGRLRETYVAPEETRKDAEASRSSQVNRAREKRCTIMKKKPGEEVADRPRESCSTENCRRGKTRENAVIGEGLKSNTREAEIQKEKRYHLSRGPAKKAPRGESLSLRGETGKN